MRRFERVTTASELGFWLLLAPNAIAALRQPSDADVVPVRGSALNCGEFRPTEGAVLMWTEVPSPESSGVPIVVALRPALYGVLLDAVGTKSITLGWEIVRFAADESVVAT